jgi:hypothetical protein
MVFMGCMVLAAAVSRLPFLAEPNGNMAVVPYLATWLACGFVAGFLVPERPWRWGIAMAIGPPIAGMAFNPQMAFLVLVMIPLIPVVATPIVMGAYMGRFVSPGRTAMTTAPPTLSTPAPISSRLFVVFAVGLVASAIPVFFLPKSSYALFMVWIGTASAVAATSVAWASSGIIKRTAIAICMVMGAFMTAVMYDTATGGPNHYMLPFEMLYVIVVTSVPAASLALLTHGVVRRVRVRHPSFGEPPRS